MKNIYFWYGQLKFIDAEKTILLLLKLSHQFQHLLKLNKFLTYLELSTMNTSSIMN